MRPRSTDTSADDNDLVKTSNSVASGRAFFLGGISPLLTRSYISTHLEKFVEFAGSNLSAVKSKPPFFVSASWHSTQCLSTKGLHAGGKSPARTVPAATNSKPGWAKKLLPIKRRMLKVGPYY